MRRAARAVGLALVATGSVWLAGCDGRTPTGGASSAGSQPTGSSSTGAQPADLSRLDSTDRAALGLAESKRPLLLGHREPAPDIAFTGPGGETFTLSRFAGRVVVLNLWATWCAPCVREMPALDRLAVLRPELAVVAVSLDAKGPAVAEQFMRQHRLANLPVYHEGKGEALRLAGARGLPVSFVIDRQGRVATIIEGAIDWTSPYMLELLSKV